MTDTRSPITTHALDTASGRPAAGLPITLGRYDAASKEFETLAEKTTNADGRVSGLLEPGQLAAGTYRMRFDTKTYFSQAGVHDYFYPLADVVFEIRAGAEGQHYHVPLLLSPFGYSTYRGS